MHTHSHYLLFLIGLRHCRKLVPRICQSVSQPTDVSERKPGQHSQVHLFGWRDRSADQCLLCAAGSSTKRKWSLSIGPNSCPTCTALGRAGLASQLPKQPQQLQEISLLHPPAFPLGGSVGPPKSRLSEPPVPLAQPHTSSTGGWDLPDTRTAVGHESQHPSPPPEESELHTGVQAHFSLTHQPHFNSHTVFHGPSEKHRDIPTLTPMEKTEMMLESCMNKIFCFSPHTNTKPELTVPLATEKSAPKQERLTYVGHDQYIWSPI